ncbi:MAG TPA: S8 family serine peptidase, partial [Geminicoccaceae bacterium]|nr:S8 family serine peptidase [Geminicoccaceae bacterium]
VAAYAHFLGHFGPERPGGVDVAPFDGGTSAAAPVAAGVGALLLSALRGAVTPGLLKEALIQGATPLGGPGGPAGWNPDTGYGVVNAGAAYDWLRTALAS